MSVSRTALNTATLAARGTAAGSSRAGVIGWTTMRSRDQVGSSERSFGTSSRLANVAAESSSSSTASSSSVSSKHSRSTSSSSTKTSTALVEPITALPPALPRTHNHLVAQIKFYSHTSEPLERFSHFALHTAHSLNIPTTRPASLPTSRSLYTVLKSPFVHKKAQENFESRTYIKSISLYDAHPRVVDMFLRYLTQNSIQGVGMRAKTFESLELGTGRKEMEGVLKRFKENEEEVLKEVEGIKRDLGEDAKVDKREKVEEQK